MELAVIHSKTDTIRNQLVILDFDLAKMYSLETLVLNQAVKRINERFPEDFMFQLNEYECNSMSSQFVMK